MGTWQTNMGGRGGGSAERSPILSLYYIRVMDMYSSLRWGGGGQRDKGEKNMGSEKL
jgi:hypothetical protein